MNNWHDLSSGGNDDSDNEPCEGCGEVHPKGSGGIISLMLSMMKQIHECDSFEEAKPFIEQMLVGIMQAGHEATQDITNVMKAALHAAGYRRLAWRIQKCLITMPPFGEHIGFGLGFRPEAPEGLDITDDEKAALNNAMVTAMWTGGVVVEPREDGGFKFVGRVDDQFDGYQEDEVAAFAEAIDKELGASAEENNGPRRFW